MLLIIRARDMTAKALRKLQPFGKLTNKMMTFKREENDMEELLITPLTAGFVPAHYSSHLVH